MSDLMKEVKAKSSKHINDHRLTPERFEWQRGFGVFSYSQSEIQNVYRYILNQEAHHAKRKFRDEYLELLEKFQVEYDEQYLFEDLI